MKIYRNLTEGVIRSLEKIFREGRYADRVLEHLFKENRKWGARDRRFVAETTYDMVRNYRLLKELAGADNLYRMLGVYFILHDIQVPEWPEFGGLDKKDFERRWNEAKEKRAVFESIPDWLDELGSKELGNKWPAELRALNEQAPAVLRANTLKTSAASLQKKLAEEGTETILLQEESDALVLRQKKNVFSSPLFQQGLFEIQDASSQLVAPFLQAKPGMSVIDACAGAGGKTLHLAALMKNKGSILSMDVEERKLDELKRRAQRAGARIIETKLISSKENIDKLRSSADRLLLDVPCSGLGVLKRNPDAKWKLSEAQLEEVKQKQRNILQDYTGMLKKGGLLVYATCSILPSENQEQVKWFLSENPSFSFTRERIVLPSEGFDGFYMCLMQRIA